MKTETCASTPLASEVSESARRRVTMQMGEYGILNPGSADAVSGAMIGLVDYVGRLCSVVRGCEWQV